MYNQYYNNNVSTPKSGHWTKYNFKKVQLLYNIRFEIQISSADFNCIGYLTFTIKNAKFT